MKLNENYLLKAHVLVSTHVFRNLPTEGGAPEPSFTFSLGSPTKSAGDITVLAQVEGKQGAVEFSVVGIGILVPGATTEPKRSAPTLGDLRLTYGVEMLYDWLTSTARQATAGFLIDLSIPPQAPEPFALKS